MDLFDFKKINNFWNNNSNLGGLINDHSTCLKWIVVMVFNSSLKSLFWPTEWIMVFWSFSFIFLLFFNQYNKSKLENAECFKEFLFKTMLWNVNTIYAEYVPLDVVWFRRLGKPLLNPQIFPICFVGWKNLDCFYISVLYKQWCSQCKYWLEKWPNNN